MRLPRSFFSLYFIIILVFIIFSWLLDELWSSYLEQDIESYTGYKIMLTAISDYVNKHPEEEWKELVANTGQRYNLPLSLISLSEFEQNKLSINHHLFQDSTHVYFTDDKVTIHHIIGTSGKVLNLGPVVMPTRPRVEALIRVVILGILGILIFIWLWPVSRDLDYLKKAAIKFGDGHFNTRAPTAKSTMMSPMIAAFNLMANRTNRLIEAHKELTNAVSHELRTPLARSKFALQMLSSTKDEEKQQRYINQVNNDIVELEEMVNEMLIYASFDSDKPELSLAPVNITHLIEQQVQKHDQFEGNIEFINKTENLTVACDSHFIDRAVNNYLNNAIKYGAGQVKITLETSKGEKGEDCIICVEDNGEGISNDFKKIIFDVFSRGDQSRNRETGGFGLGLAIVARIMEWHKGTVSVDDSKLGGALFRLRWPVEFKKKR